jgi:uncharacterized protein (DUF1800 family)
VTSSDEARVAHVWRRLGFGPARGDVEAGVTAGGATAVIDDLLARPTTTVTDWKLPADQGNTADIDRFVARLYELWAWGAGPVQERISWMLGGVMVAGFSAANQYKDLKDHHSRLRAWPSTSYKALLSAVAKSDAMQKYLDGIGSHPPHANENLARELMELFSLGVTHPVTGASNYSETDIKEIARALTGYGWNGQPGPNSVAWYSAYWDSGDKTFLGAARGAAALPEVIDAVTASAGFQHFMPSRIYRELVGYDPPAARLSSLANAWGPDGNVKGVVSYVAHLPEFTADATIGNRVKTPVELLVSALRTLGCADADHLAINWMGSVMRQEVLNPPDVSGWTDPWLHPSHLMLWSKVAYWLATNDNGSVDKPLNKGTPPDQQNTTIRHLYAEATSSTAADTALRFAGLYDVSPQTRGAVDTYAKAGTWDWNRACGTMQLVLVSPEFLVS